MFNEPNFTKTELKIIEDLPLLENYIEQVAEINQTMTKQLLSGEGKNVQYFMLQIFHYANRFTKVFKQSLFGKEFKIKNKRNEIFYDLENKQQMLLDLGIHFVNYIHTYSEINKYTESRSQDKTKLNLLKEEIISSFNSIEKLSRQYATKYLNAQLDYQR